jgi:glutamyl-Q tRNA(Asp) synthetase
LVRIEDLDTPRVVPGSADQILHTLERLGFEWDESVLYQSSRRDEYEAALERLRAQAQCYPCSCTRLEIAAGQPQGAQQGDEMRYAGWCRGGVRSPGRAVAIRLLVGPRTVRVSDDIQGELDIDVAAEAGDFVIRRRDGLHAYQLAVTVDDALQRVTHVVRGADLLSSTPRQLLLQQALDFPQPRYAHLLVATDAHGAKLSKSAGAAALDDRRPVGELWRALQFLRQAPPTELLRGELNGLWQWAFAHWDLNRLRSLKTACLPAAVSVGIEAGMD